MWHHKQIYYINKRSIDTLHAFIPIEFDNYPSLLILKHAKISAEVNKLHNANILKLMTYKKYMALKYIYTQWT